MRNTFRYILPLFAALFTLFLFSCEQEAVQPSPLADTSLTLAEAVEYNKDGSYSYQLTADQMVHILENEFGQMTSDNVQEMTIAFARLAADNSPFITESSGKPGTGTQKMTTYGIGAQVTTITTSGQQIIDFEGVGGLPATAGPVSASADGFRRQNLTINMSAIAYVFTSVGSGAVLFVNDSSADVGTCPGKSFERNLKGDADVTFNGPLNSTGTATVKCSRGIEAEELPQEFELCC